MNTNDQQPPNPKAGERSEKPPDTRHLRRIRFIQKLFAYGFGPDNVPESDPQEDEQFKQIVAKLPEIDVYVKQAAPKYPLENMIKTDLAILRMAVYELIINKSNPSRVVINEAIEVAKELGSVKSPGFIHAALGSLYDTHLAGLEGKHEKKSKTLEQAVVTTPIQNEPESILSQN